MAFFDQAQGSEEGKASKFNEGALQMIRIHEIQRRINYANLNPLQFYSEENLFGYQVILNSYNSLFEEASSKCDSKEVTATVKKKEFIELTMRLSPVHKTKNNHISHESQVQVNFTNWRTLKKLLFTYGLTIRELLEKHKLTSPEADDLSGL